MWWEGVGFPRGRGSITKEGLRMARKMGQEPVAAERWQTWDGWEEEQPGLLEELGEECCQGLAGSR